MSANGPATPQDALRTMRIIGLALGAGVTLFALVTWVIHRQAPPPLSADGPWMFYLWVALATSLAAASMVFWRGSVAPLIERPVSIDEWRRRAARLQASLVICWSLVEAAALFGVVVYFLEGTVLTAFLGIAMIWGAVAITWPDDAWLGIGSQIPG